METVLGIKLEPAHSIENPEHEENEKENLIAQLVKLRKEFDDTVHSLKQENEKISNELKTSKLQLQEQQNIVKELNNQIKKLKEQSNTQPKDSPKNEEYEVEKLLKDKMIGNKHCYLVRWKGYDATYDTWEPISNLHCPKILQKYHKQH